jgi:PST family polysaccharide transporter
MLALALAAAAVSLLAAWLAPESLIVPMLVASQAVPSACVLFVARPRAARPRFRMGSHPLRRYVLPGLAIGILGPASMLLARGEIGAVLGWHQAGVVQALWRLADWVCAFAAGLLSLHYLPRFAAARGGAALNAEMRQAALWLLPPAAAAFAALWIAHRPLLGALYGPGFEASDASAALFFAGSLLRVASWIPLFALYAARRTSAITAGELLSLPLFALSICLAGARLSVEAAGALWVAAFGAYALFNLAAATRPQ